MLSIWSNDSFHTLFSFGLEKGDRRQQLVSSHQLPTDNLQN